MKIPTIVVATAAVWTVLFASPFADAEVTCGPAGGSLAIAGSSTVGPVAKQWAKAYMEQCDVNIAIEEGGSSAGAKRLCAVGGAEATPVDIGTMSRMWHPEEAESDYSGYKFVCIEEASYAVTKRSVIQIDVAVDGLPVTVAANSSVAKCIAAMGGLTKDQLRWIYSNYPPSELELSGWNTSSLANSDNLDDTHLWSELSADCPSTEINIAGPDVESGTYEFFKEAILADSKDGETFGDRLNGYFNSTDDGEIVKFVESDLDAIGFFGYSYYSKEGSTLLYAIPILNFAGVYVAPEPGSVSNGTYFPLSRKLYMNLWNDPTSLESTAPFIEFVMSKEGTDAVNAIGYVPIPESERAIMISRAFSEQEGKPATKSPSGSAPAGAPTSSAWSTFDLNFGFVFFLVVGAVNFVLL